MRGKAMAVTGSIFNLNDFSVEVGAIEMDIIVVEFFAFHIKLIPLNCLSETSRISIRPIACMPVYNSGSPRYASIGKHSLQISKN